MVTNFHVIEDAHRIELKIHTGEIVGVESIIGIDELHDLAILNSSWRGPPLILAPAVQVGEEVLVIGNPQVLDATISPRIASGMRCDEENWYYQITPRFLKAAAACCRRNPKF